MPRFPTISSFFVAVFIYLVLVLALFFALVDSSERAKKYTDDKDAFMDVIIDVPEISPEITQIQKATPPQEQPKQDEPKKEPEPIKEQPKVEPQIPNPLPQEQPKAKEPPKPEIPEPKADEPKEQKPDLKELFGSIDTTKFKPEPKPQPKPQKPSNEASKIVNSLKLDKSAKAPKSQKTGIYNPLYGAIEKQIQRKWQSYKADSNNEAKVRVSIDTNGRFSYEIISLPYDDEFNSKVKECLQALTLETFAHGSSLITLDLTLVDKLFR